MTAEIKQKLDRLAQLQDQVAAMELNFQDQRDTILTAEIKAQLGEIDANEAAALEDLQVTINALTAEIKCDVLAAGATVQGTNWQAVWSAGRVTWDAKALDGFALAHPEIQVFRKVGQPSVTLRPRGGK